VLFRTIYDIPREEKQFQTWYAKLLNFSNRGYLPKVFIGSDRRVDMHVRVSLEDYHRNKKDFLGYHMCVVP
jgi:hypothetical protein